MKKVAEEKKGVVAHAKTDCEELLVEIVQDKRVADEQEKQVCGLWRFREIIHPPCLQKAACELCSEQNAPKAGAKHADSLWPGTARLAQHMRPSTSVLRWLVHFGSEHESHLKGSEHGLHLEAQNQEHVQDSSAGLD